MIARAQWLGLVGALVLLLALPAIANGFPLIFPDSGTYLVIAFGSEYAIDRSSFYGLMWKPFVTAFAGVDGLWIALAAQLAVVAAILVAAGRFAAPAARPWLLLAVLAPIALLTALPWHAGQVMPDAFTGAVILLAWMAASRAPGADGAALLWACAALLATTHYTHPILLGGAAFGAVVGQLASGLSWRAAWRRMAAAALAALAAIGAMVAANGAALDRWVLSPTGGVFLFARMHEDGLTKPWFDRHCGQDAPAALCAVRDAMPDDSQAILWGAERSPIHGHIWQTRDEAERWRWAGMLGDAARGSILQSPMMFAGQALDGTYRQLRTFAAIDDECPAGCSKRSGGIGFALNRYRPDLLPRLDASMQVQGTTPKVAVRWVSGAVTTIGLLLLPIMLAIALRRRDGVLAGLVIAVGLALIVNAAMAGALSDVHDRYQSRVVWLAPLVAVLGAIRARVWFAGRLRGWFAMPRVGRKTAGL